MSLTQQLATDRRRRRSASKAAPHAGAIGPNAATRLIEVLRQDADFATVERIVDAADSAGVALRPADHDDRRASRRSSPQSDARLPRPAQGRPGAARSRIADRGLSSSRLESRVGRALCSALCRPARRPRADPRDLRACVDFRGNGHVHRARTTADLFMKSARIRSARAKQRQNPFVSGTLRSSRDFSRPSYRPPPK